MLRGASNTKNPNHLHTLSRDSSIATSEETPPGPVRPGAWKAFSASAVGIEMGLCVLLGWGAGTWADSALGSAPWAMLAGLLFGVAAGFRALVRGSKEAWDQGSESKESE